MNKVTLEQWSRLYQAAIRVKEMAPWEWMFEADLFGVRNVDTGEVGFVSVMGTLGEHLSVAVYLGDEGLSGFWMLHMDDSPDHPEQVLEVPQLQASFEDRDMLTNQDRRVIKELGLKFRGRKAWPLFRSYRPGYFPWYLEPDEAQFLALALEQLIEIAPRVREDPAMLEQGQDEYLIREAKGSGDALEWSERVEKIIPQPKEISIMIDMEALERLQGVRQRTRVIEMDFFLLPFQIGERKERPKCAYNLLVVEGRSGMVLGSQLLTPEPTLETVFGAVPSAAVRILAKVGLLCQEVRVRSELLVQLLTPLEEVLGFEVRMVQTLPMLDQARAFMDRFLG